VLHDFNSATGASPQVTLFQHTNGKLYGDTAVGGSVNNGTFYSFDAGLGPFIGFMPRARRVGHGVNILGQGFTGATAVSFNGTPASFVVVSDTFIQAIVPDHATSGFLMVKTPTGTLKSNRTFLVKPQVVGFSPASGAVGRDSCDRWGEPEADLEDNIQQRGGSELHCKFRLADHSSRARGCTVREDRDNNHWSTCL
jgi:hypothetical protein